MKKFPIHELRGKRLVSVEDGASNQKVLIFSDGHHLVVGAEARFIPGCGSVPYLTFDLEIEDVDASS